MEAWLKDYARATARQLEAAARKLRRAANEIPRKTPHLDLYLDDASELVTEAATRVRNLKKETEK
jgi:hypothetical protein